METRPVILDCARIRDPDIAVVDRIAGLSLCLRRAGYELRLAHAGRDLLDLIELAGLSGVLGVEVHGQSEQREQPRRVEEEGDLADPSL